MENIPSMFRRKSSSSPPPGLVRDRLVSVDVMRGLTIALMILVNNPGSWSAMYAPLRHARWHGWTPTDLIFPFFLFIVGVSIVLALGPFAPRSAGHARGDTGSRARAARKVLFRAAILILLGLFLNAYPVLRWDGPGWHENFTNSRIPGVLQRIGLCYGFAGLLFLYIRRPARLLFLLLLLPAYWALLMIAPVPEFGPGRLDSPAGNIAAWVDRLVMGKHIYRGGPFDPEGLLSTLPALGTTLLGIHAGELIAWPRKQAVGNPERPKFFAPMLLIACGLVLLAGGLFWDKWLPVNKTLWTSSYVLVTGGLAMVLLGILYELIENRGMARVFLPARIYGVNALLVFAGSALLARTLNLIRVAPGVNTSGKTISLQKYIFTQYFQGPGSPEFASLMYALTWVAGWFLILALLYRAKVFIRI